MASTETITNQTAGVGIMGEEDELRKFGVERALEVLPPSQEQLMLRNDPELVEFLSIRKALRSNLNEKALAQKGEPLTPMESILIDEFVDRKLPLGKKYRGAEAKFNTGQYDPQTNQWIPEPISNFMHSTVKNWAMGAKALPELLSFTNPLAYGPSGEFLKIQEATDEWKSMVDRFVNFWSPTPITEMDDPNRFISREWREPPDFWSWYNMGGLAGHATATMTQLFVGSGVGLWGKLQWAGPIGKYSPKVAGLIRGLPGAVVTSMGSAVESADQVKVWAIEEGYTKDQANILGEVTKAYYFPLAIAANYLGPEVSVLGGKTLARASKPSRIGNMFVAGGQETVESASEFAGQEIWKTAIGMNEVLTRSEDSEFPFGVSFAPWDQNSPYKKRLIDFRDQMGASFIVGGLISGSLSYDNARHYRIKRSINQNREAFDQPSRRMLEQIAMDHNMSPEAAGAMAGLIDQGWVRQMSQDTGMKPDEIYSRVFAESSRKFDPAQQVLYTSRPEMKLFKNRVLEALTDESFEEELGRVNIPVRSVIDHMKKKGVSDHALYWSGISEYAQRFPDQMVDQSALLHMVEANDFDLGVIGVAGYSDLEMDEIRDRLDRNLEMDKVLVKELNRVEQKEDVEGIKQIRQQLRDHRLQARAFTEQLSMNSDANDPTFKQRVNRNAGPESINSRMPEMWFVSTPRYWVGDETQRAEGQEGEEGGGLIERMPSGFREGNFYRASLPEQFRTNHIFHMRIDETDVFEEGVKVPALRVFQVRSPLSEHLRAERDRLTSPEIRAPLTDVNQQVEPWRVYAFKLALIEATKRGKKRILLATADQNLSWQYGVDTEQAAAFRPQLLTSEDPESKDRVAEAKENDRENTIAFRQALKELGVSVRTLPVMKVRDQKISGLTPADMTFLEENRDLAGAKVVQEGTEFFIQDANGDNVMPVALENVTLERSNLERINQRYADIKARMSNSEPSLEDSWGFEITPEIRKKILTEGFSQFAKIGGQKVASTSFLYDGKAVVQSLSSAANAPAFLHEIGHVLRRWFLDPVQQQRVMKLLKIQRWDTKGEERFANWVVAAVANKKVLVPAGLQDFIKKSRDALGNIYKSGIEGLTRLPESPELNHFMEDLFFDTKSIPELMRLQHEEVKWQEELTRVTKELESEKKKPDTKGVQQVVSGRLTEQQEIVQRLTTEKARAKENYDAALKAQKDILLSTVLATPPTPQELRQAAFAKNKELKEVLDPKAIVKQHFYQIAFARRSYGLMVRYSGNLITPAARRLVQDVQQMWDRSIRLHMGKFDNLVQWYGQPSRKARKILETFTKKYGTTIYDDVLEGRLQVDQIAPPEHLEELNNYFALARSITQYFGLEAEKRGMWRTLQNGDQVPVKEMQNPVMLRFMTPFMRETMMMGGKNWKIFKEQVLSIPENVADGLTEEALDIWQKQHKDNPSMSREGFIEKARGIKILPSKLVDKNGKMVGHILVANPIDYLGRLLRFGALRISLVDIMGQRSLKNVYQKKGKGKADPGYRSLLNIFGISERRTRAELEEAIHGVQPGLDLSQQSDKQVKQWATQLRIDHKRDDATLLGMIRQLGPVQAQKAGLKADRLNSLLRIFGRRIGGVDTRKGRNTWDLLSDIKRRFEQKVEDDIFSKYVEGAKGQGEDMKGLEQYLEDIQGEPRTAIETSPGIRMIEMVNSLGMVWLLSASAPLNLAQLPFLGIGFGVKNSVKALHDVIYNMPEVDEILRDFAALRQLHYTYAGDATHPSTRIARTVEDAAGKFLGISAVNDFIDLIAGRSGHLTALEWKEKGIRTKLQRVKARYFGLTDADIAEINAGNMNDGHISQVVNKFIQRANVGQLSPTDKSSMELDPRWKLVRALKTYGINMSRNIWDLGTIMAEGISKRDAGLVGGSALLGLALAIGIFGNSAVTDWMKRKRLAKPYTIENEDYRKRAFWALAEAGVMFPFDQLAISTRYAYSAEEVALNQAPTLSLIMDVIRGGAQLTQDIINETEGGDVPLEKRGRQIAESMSLGRAAIRHIDRLSRPERAEYNDIREEVINWRKKQPNWKESTIQMGVEKDWMFEHIYEALLDSDHEALSQARTVKFKEWIRKGEDPNKAQSDLVKRLMRRRPLNLTIEEMFKFQQSVSEDLWDRAMYRNDMYVKDLYMIMRDISQASDSANSPSE